MEKQNPTCCLPGCFRTLIDRGQIRREDMLATSDGFFMLKRSLATILTAAGIDTFPDREGMEAVKEAYEDGWDDSEFYLVRDELEQALPQFDVDCIPISFCADVLILSPAE